MPEYIPSRPIIDLRSLVNVEKMQFPPPGVFSFARYALIYYLMYLSFVQKREIRNVLLPDYMCHEVGAALRGYGYEPHYYSLDRHFDIRFGVMRELIEEPHACNVMIIGHFYGRICRNFEEVARVCRERDICVIEDCVHLPFPYHSGFADTSSDAKLFTLRKVYPVPHGAVIVLREGQEQFGRFVAVNISKRRGQGIWDATHWACLQIVKKYLQLTGTGYRVRYRDISRDPLKPFNYAFPGIDKFLSMKNCRDAVWLRRRNYELYTEHVRVFESWGEVLEYDIEKDVPYMFLILLNEEYDARAIVRSLFRYGVPAVLGLALDPSVVRVLPCKHSYNQIITLPIHQDINERHIRHIADVLSSKSELTS